MTTTNRLSPLRFVLAFGVVSGLADVVYEGARAIVGPFLANLGASALVVGFVTGVGEAVALVLRLGTGRLSDRTGRHWALSIIGYLMTVAAVPPLALSQALWQAALLVVAERFGKAVRTPARDTMLAQASSRTGRGRAFAIHEALDQSGAVVGPLVVAAMVAISGYRLGFGVLVVPGVATLVLLVWLRRAVPVPGAYEGSSPDPMTAAATGQRFSARFWAYTAFTAMTMLGYATFGVLSYHLQVRHIVPEPLIPVLYAVAMGVAALAALASGAIYDRIGLRGLVVLPVLAAAVAFLSYSSSVALVCVGAVVWGAAMGVHESTMRAAVADMVPAARRGVGFGTFTAVYGLAWLAGGTILGALYGYSISALITFTILTQALALVLFVPLLRAR
ncbi:MAG: MFS transporter [Pseudonocardiales bacterium]|nr:MFS transporter [Pseudonocardiales bacterium]MBV9728010.1 MFS transporter [Pseudonocardiales bacterium]